MNTGNPPEHPYLWARLHSDGIFLGLLALLSGLIVIIDPSQDPLVKVTGELTFIYWRSATLALSGGMLIYGLIKVKPSIEVIGRITMIWTVVFQIFRVLTVCGWGPLAAGQILVLLALGLVTWMRVSALNADPGFVIQIPPVRPGSPSQSTDADGE